MTTTLKDQITAAVAAHSMWKSRLFAAIETGKSKYTSAKVAPDNQCEFGKWLHGSIDATMRAAPDYATVKDLHARFHKEAAKVLRLVEDGKIPEAKAALGGEYTAVSTKLVQQLQSWKAK